MYYNTTGIGRDWNERVLHLNSEIWIKDNCSGILVWMVNYYVD